MRAGAQGALAQPLPEAERGGGLTPRRSLPTLQARPLTPLANPSAAAAGAAVTRARGARQREAEEAARPGARGQNNQPEPPGTQQVRSEGHAAARRHSPGSVCARIAVAPLSAGTHAGDCSSTARRGTGAWLRPVQSHEGTPGQRNE